MNKWLRHSILAVILLFGISGGMAFSSVDAQAKTIRHFETRTIKYHIDSTGRYYQSVWGKAINRWNKLNVVKLVKVKNAKNANLRLSTIKKDHDYAYSYSHESFAPSSNASLSIYKTEKISLSKYFMKYCGYFKYNRVDLATQAIGDALGLESSGNENSIMSRDVLLPSKISKADKKNLQKLYKNIPY